MNRSIQLIAGIVAVAATATPVWMPTPVLAGITASGVD